MDRKSEFGSVVLTAIFGPFGLLYSNVMIALSMVMAWTLLLATYLDNFSRADSFRELCGIIYYSGGSIKNSAGYFFVGCFLYIVTIVLGMIMVIKYNNEMKEFIDLKMEEAVKNKIVQIEKAQQPIIVDLTDEINSKKVFCTKCGKENKSDAKFCTSCGSGIATSV